MKLSPEIIAVISGVILIVLELFFWTSFILPIGIALVVGGIVHSATENLWISLLGFIISLLAGYWLSFRYSWKQRGLKGIFHELRKQDGIVINKVDDFTYEVRFPLGAAGEEVWIAYSEGSLEYGDRVKVVEVKGNKLVVKKEKNA
jgi:membrane protein implicated in regulation of membrane protease activity